MINLNSKRKDEYEARVRAREGCLPMTFQKRESHRCIFHLEVHTYGFLQKGD